MSAMGMREANGFWLIAGAAVVSRPAYWEDEMAEGAQELIRLRMRAG